MSRCRYWALFYSRRRALLPLRHIIVDVDISPPLSMALFRPYDMLLSCRYFMLSLFDIFTFIFHATLLRRHAADHYFSPCRADVTWWQAPCFALICYAFDRFRYAFRFSCRCHIRAVIDGLRWCCLRQRFLMLLMLMPLIFAAFSSFMPLPLCWCRHAAIRFIFFRFFAPAHSASAAMPLRRCRYAPCYAATYACCFSFFACFSLLLPLLISMKIRCFFADASRTPNAAYAAITRRFRYAMPLRFSLDDYAIFAILLRHWLRWYYCWLIRFRRCRIPFTSSHTVGASLPHDTVTPLFIRWCTPYDQRHYQYASPCCQRHADAVFHYAMRHYAMLIIIFAAMLICHYYYFDTPPLCRHYFYAIRLRSYITLMPFCHTRVSLLAAHIFHVTTIVDFLFADITPPAAAAPLLFRFYAFRCYAFSSIRFSPFILRHYAIHTLYMLDIWYTYATIRFSLRYALLADSAFITPLLLLSMLSSSAHVTLVSNRVTWLLMLRYAITPAPW